MDTTYSQNNPTDGARGRRRKYLINPRFQWKFAGVLMLTVFAACSFMTVILSGVLYQQERARTAERRHVQHRSRARIVRVAALAGLQAVVEPVPVCVRIERVCAGVEGGDEDAIRLGTREFTVIGVLAPYQPTPKFYDVVNSLAGETNEFFVPFDLVREEDLSMSVTGNTDSYGDNSTFVGDLIFTTAEWYWIQFWVEVEPDRQAEYVAFVDDYSRNLKALGRYPRPLNNRVTPMMDWVAERNQAGGITVVIMILSMLFLAVCAINLTGLLLGKFLAKANRIGIYRALGAPRRSVFMQHIIECELVGLLGGAAGILLAMLALRLIVRMMPDLSGYLDSEIFRLDGTMIAVAIGLALLAGLSAGIYPAWRASRTSPAMQINVT